MGAWAADIGTGLMKKGQGLPWGPSVADGTQQGRRKRFEIKGSEGTGLGTSKAQWEKYRKKGSALGTRWSAQQTDLPGT